MTGGGDPGSGAARNRHEPDEEPRRRRILDRVARATAERERPEHPGELDTVGDLDPSAASDPVTLFALRFREAGGEVVTLRDAGDAERWLEEFATGFRTVAASPDVEDSRVPGDLDRVPPREAELGISVAARAVAETASLLLSAAAGRKPQVLPRAHLVWVPRERVVLSLAEALEGLAEGAARGESFALHSGPSKSADMAGHLVRGVHGPGRVVAAVVG